MTATDPAVRVTLRIPGVWQHPGELFQRVPEGFRLTADSLYLPDGTEVEFAPLDPDGQFADVFESACRRPPSDDELALVRRYTVNLILSGPGGSLAAARTMMQAAAALLQAGGAGVFIDNSALAHGGGLWREMTDDGSPDAVSYAFVGIVGTPEEIYTIGMHVLGFPEIIMRRVDVDPAGDAIIDVIRYVCNGDRPIAPGDLLGDELGPRFQATLRPADPRDERSPLHNPYGSLFLISLRDAGERN